MAKSKRKKQGKTPKRRKPKNVPVKSGPPVPTDIRALVNPWAPQLPREKQLEMLAKYQPSETYTVPIETHEAFATSARPGTAMLVAETCLLAERRNGKGRMVTTMLHWMNEIHALGGFVLEASSGLRSDRATWRRTMIERATEMLGRLAQGAKSAENARRGAAAHDFTKEECQVMLAIKYDRRYTNWASRYVAMRKAGIKKPPKRTWFIESLDAYARNLGLDI